MLAEEDAANTVEWLLADHQGTIRDVAEYDSQSEETTVVNHLAYDAFGRITGQTTPAKQPCSTYTGRLWDADAGLYYYRARWYDAGVGSFLSADPLGFGAGDANLHRYVRNSPLTRTDPSGLIQIDGGDCDLGVYPYPGYASNVGAHGYTGNGLSGTQIAAHLSMMAAACFAPGSGVASTLDATGEALDFEYTHDEWVMATAHEATGSIEFAAGDYNAALMTQVDCAAYASATTFETTVAVGSQTGRLTVQGVNAFARISTDANLTPGFLKTLIGAARTAGAESLELDTGLTISPVLNAKLTALAQSGGSFLGGTVRMVGGGGTPIFKILIPFL